MFMELSRACYKVAKDLAKVKPGENVLVLSDTIIEREVIDGVTAAAYSLGAEAVQIIY